MPIRPALLALIAASLTSAGASMPEAASLDARIAAANAYSAAHRGQALLILQNGREVYAAGENGYDLNTPHLLASGTKSFWGLAAAAAVQDGLLTSLDERVADTVPGWRTDPLKSQITVRLLLSLSSGLNPGEDGQAPSYAQALQVPAVQKPGSTFAYGPAPYQAFGGFFQMKLQPRGFADPLAYLKARLLDPIGLKVSGWKGSERHMPGMPAGAYLTAREWAKWGQLVLQDGSWNGKTLIRPDLLAQVFTSSPANPAYGLTWWLGTPNGAGEGGPAVGPALTALPGFKMAAGKGQQRLYVIPSQNLVVVRFAEPSHYDDLDFLERLTGVKLR